MLLCIAAFPIVIPLMLFGIELLVFAVAAGAALLGALVVAPRWVIRATNARTGEVFEQEIAGRRASHVALGTLATLIRAGQRPRAGRASAADNASVVPPVRHL